MDQPAKDKFANEQDANKLSLLFSKKFGILPVIGAAFGNFQTAKWSIISYFVYVVSYTSTILTTMDLIYTSYLLLGNISMLSVSFHLFLVGCVVLTASISMTLQRKRITKLMLGFFFNPNICEYQSSSPYYEMLKRKSDMRLQRLVRGFVLSYGACGMVGLSIPFVDMYLGLDESVTNVSGIYWKKLPIAMWWPLDSHNSLTAYISSLICQGVFAICAPNMVTSAIILAFFSCEEIINHMKLLIHSVEHLDQRARSLFECRHPGKSLRGFESEYELCYYECIIQNVKHHHEIVKAKTELMEIANYAIAVPFFGGAMLLGLAGLNLLTHDDPRIEPKMLLVALGMTEAANILLLCMYGEEIHQISRELFNSVFYTRWYLRSMKFRRALMIFQLGTVKPMKINAAQLIELNMQTFGNLMNSAYSIFNLSVASG